MLDGENLTDVYFEYFFPLMKNISYGWIFYEVPHRQRVEQKELHIRMSSSTIRGVLDALMTADTSYYWITDGVVVNFIPKVQTRFDVMARLEQRLPIYEIREEDMVGAVAELIEQGKAQGVGGFFSATKPTETMRKEAEGWIPDRNWKITLSMKNKTVRECLNAIVASDPPSYWWTYPEPEGLLLRVHPRPSYNFHRPRMLPEDKDRFAQLLQEISVLVGKQIDKTITEEELELLEIRRAEMKEMEEKFGRQ